MVPDQYLSCNRHLYWFKEFGQAARILVAEQMLTFRSAAISQYTGVHHL